MQEVINSIVENVRFDKKQEFTLFLNKCINQYVNKDEEEKESLREFKSVIFSLEKFSKNFSAFVNEFGKDRKYEAGVEALFHIAEALKIDLDKSDCFILFHVKDLGKFRKKESVLLTELKGLWPKYKEYALDDQSFSAALRNLRKEKAIIYRKGNLQVAQSIIVRYKV